jgi:hypothetical protein
MATIASKPTWAPCVWKDNQGRIFAQFADGYVHMFQLTEISKLIKIIPTVESQPGFVSGGQNVADTIIKRTKAREARKAREKRAVQPLDEATASRIANLAKRLEEKK